MCETSLELLFLLALYPSIHMLFYINVIRGCQMQSISYFLQASAQRSTNRIQEETLLQVCRCITTPGILINNSSTIMEEEGNINSNLLTAALPPQNHYTDGLVIKLNHLKEKPARYNSHRDFHQNVYSKALSQRGQKSHLSQSWEILTKAWLIIGISIFGNSPLPSVLQFSILHSPCYAVTCNDTAGKKLLQQHSLKSLLL